MNKSPKSITLANKGLRMRRNALKKTGLHRLLYSLLLGVMALPSTAAPCEQTRIINKTSYGPAAQCTAR